ncbi:DUF6883 domain-containing protein [Egbenema bharatensis]|uniref:DUF6883 domain-containing protein n=1 Tax=Egbenema bharatensis TaxID=3463334 RepID=UPI003A87F824
MVIQDRKLTHYLLVYQAEDDKSEFLARAGYKLQNWQLLKRDILKAMESAEIAEVTRTDWGTRFKVKSEWVGLNGQRLEVITIWQQDEGTSTARFITLYPDKLRSTDTDREK